MAFQRFHDQMMTRNKLLFEFSQIYLELAAAEASDSEIMDQELRDLAFRYAAIDEGGFLDPQKARGLEHLSTHDLLQRAIHNIYSQQFSTTLLDEFWGEYGDIKGTESPLQDILAIGFFLLGFVPIVGPFLEIVSIAIGILTGDIIGVLLDLAPVGKIVAMVGDLLKPAARILKKYWRKLYRYEEQLEQVAKKVDDFNDANRGRDTAPLWGPAGDTRQSLIEELRRQGTLFNEAEIVDIFHGPDGKIYWLEEGHDGAGLQHIMGHEDDFYRRWGIVGEEPITELVLDTLRTENPIRRVYHSAKRGYELIFEVRIGGESKELLTDVTQPVEQAARHSKSEMRIVRRLRRA